MCTDFCRTHISSIFFAEKPGVYGGDIAAPSLAGHVDTV